MVAQRDVAARAGRGTDARDAVPGELTDRELWLRLSSGQARCARSNLDPDEWFPIATRWAQARAQAARALALCARCPVRAECLEYSLRQWRDIGRYGVWGGLLDEERASVRGQWLRGVSVGMILTDEATARDRRLIPA